MLVPNCQTMTLFVCPKMKPNTAVLTPNIEIDGFKTPIRKDRNLSNGSGLAIYTKNSIYSVRRQDLKNKNIENIWIEVNTFRYKFLTELFYRPPISTAEFWDILEDSFENASDLNHAMIILGDFNNDILSNNCNKKLERIMLKFNLHHIIKEATRLTENSETCLDLIMTNHKAIICNSEILAPFQSDHCTVTAEISFKTYKSQAFKKTIWKFEEANTNGIEQHLNSSDWSFINESDNMNLIMNTFEEVLTKSAENYIPKITFNVRPNDKSWMSNAIRNQMRKRDRLDHKAKSSKSPAHWQNYKNKRNEVVDLVRSAKSEYIKKLQSSLNDPKFPPKNWYSIANETTKLKNTPPHTITQG